MSSQGLSFHSVLSAHQFNKDEILYLLQLASTIEQRLQKEKYIPLLDRYILATLFFEPSTRTRLSFETAMHRLGGRVISSVGIQFSSLSKGESLYDTLKMIESYADICVIRHPMEGASALAASNISIPVINGGDGAGEHPTQALLDLYTIQKYHSLDKKITVGFVGDIKFGRTIHSLVTLLSLFDVELRFISPVELALPQKYKQTLNEKNIPIVESEDINLLKDCDIAYITRVQEERFLDHMEYEKFKDAYIIDNKFLQQCNPNIKVMHPLPRLSEIAVEVDKHPAAVYFQQANNGVYMRMALILELLKEKLS